MALYQRLADLDIWWHLSLAVIHHMWASASKFTTRPQIFFMFQLG
jgi:hypothetical protein